jgi:predicted MFS family arabinose efflux permease
MGLAKAVFDPSLYAYLGDKVPYSSRGKHIAAVELAWGGAMVLGAPLVGWIISRLGWQGAFLFVALSGALALLGLLRSFPHEQNIDLGVRSFPAFSTFRQVTKNKAAWGAFAVVFLLMASNELQIVVYGPWMESNFGLSVRGLGLATAVIGLAEILGELGAGGLVDRCGKRRSIAGGLVLTAASYFLLPVMSSSLSAALGVLFALYLCVEFSIVANLPLVTELIPGARASMMSLMVTAGALGRMAGAWVGPWLWELGGMVLNSAVAGFGVLSALALLLIFVRVDAAGLNKVTQS